MEVPQKKKGLDHLFAATTYSLAGLRYIMGETAFRHHVIAGLVLLVLYMIAGVPALHFAVALVIMFVTLSMEAVNTAIELLVDRVSPEFSEFARHAKDLGSFAVFCMLCANGAFAAFVLASVLFG